MNKYLNLFFVIFLLLASFLLTSCYKIRPSNGGGQVKKIKEREFLPSDIALPDGYKIEVVRSGLTYPSGITFDNSGNVYVIESGYSYGEDWTTPRLLRIGKDGQVSVIAQGAKNGPWTGVEHYEGEFYIAEGGQSDGGKILKISADGKISTIIDNLPSLGDHHTNGPAIKDGYIYFGQGTATNSGIVGKDNYEFGWLKRNKEFHDIPCGDITLSGKSYETENVFSKDEKALTGPYLPYNTPAKEGQIIKGSLPCSGAILRVPIKGGNLEVVAWGLRNPFGLSFSHDGKLYVSENGFDERGSRPVWGAGDVLWEIQNGQWYGWPDFSAGEPIQNDEEFKSPKSKPVKSVLAKYPNNPPKPTAILGVHSSASGLDFSKSTAFGYPGQAFIAEFGDMAPDVGKVLSPVGFKVVRVDVSNGVVEDFAVNKGKRNEPASKQKSGGLERPVSVKFDPEGNSLYIVDFGVMRLTKKGAIPQRGTGVIWKVIKE